MEIKKSNFLLKSKRIKIQFRIVIIIFILMIVLLCGVFFTFTNQYNDSINKESINNIEEINYQIKSYISNNIRNNWNALDSITNTINSIDDISEEELFKLLQKERVLWDTSSIIFYTEDNKGYDDSGNHIVDDLDTIINKIKKENKVIDMFQSSILYGVKVETESLFRGSKIVALSITRDIDTLIDRYNIATFDGNADIYITRNDGKIVTKYKNTSKIHLDNIQELFPSGKLKDINNIVVDYNSLFNGNNSFYYESNDNIDKYIAIETFQTSVSENNYYLFYIISADKINESFNKFSKYVTLLSFIEITILLLSAIAIFIGFYYTQKSYLNNELKNREMLLDLFVENTNNAFGLFKRKQEQPIYITPNAYKMLNNKILLLDPYSKKLKLIGGSKEITTDVNKELELWDEKGVFVSSEYKYSVNNEILYLQIKIYCIEKEFGDKDVIIAVQDVTNERNRTEVIKSALLSAESANNAKTQFLSNMSHDIRTPMNAIINMTDFALENLNNPVELKKYLDIIKDSSEHLLLLINDVLDMSRIESGKTSLQIVPFNLEDCINEVVNIINPLVKKKNQVFKYEMRIKNKNILGDRLKLSQVLINLLNNACKYTHNEGKIRLKIYEVEASEKGFCTYKFIVSDNGMGIDHQNLKKIYQPFSRLENERVNKIEGTGLGLSITQNFVTLMDGNIGVKSRVGLGTSFTVTISFKINNEVKEPENNEPCNQVKDISLLNKRILLCDDNDLNRVIVFMLLNKYGVIIEEADEGYKAINKFTTSAKGYYDLILMDIQMPGLNGYETSRKIRNSKHPDSLSIPIIALTANAFSEDIEKARAAGMNFHLGKPISNDKLIKAIKKVWDKSEFN